MRAHTFTIGRTAGYDFAYDAQGGLTALPGPDGFVRVIGGQLDLSADVATPDTWSAEQEATGNNVQISDGEELYAGAGFGDPLVEGQVDDVLWALGDLAARPSGRLLELGAGPGFLTEALGRRLPGWSVVGVDPSPTSCAQAQARGVDVREGFVDTVDLEPGFDAVVVMGNFQLHADPDATLRRLADLAAPGARIFLDSKNPRTLTRRIAARLVGLPAVRSQGAVHAFAAHSFHGIRNAPSGDQLRASFAATGWDVDQVRTTAPRLLRFGNTHALGRGFKGLVWRALDGVEGLTDQRAWIQLSGRRR